MPKKLESAQSVVIKGHVYVGAERTVLEYSIESDTWCELPRPPQEGFSMAVLNDSLVLVGGMDVRGIFTQNVSGKLSVWDPDRKKWTHPYPRVPFARYNVSSAGYGEFLIVVGGCELIPEDAHLVTSQTTTPSLSNVDIFNSSEPRWYSADPLPVECHSMQSTVVDDRLYVIGGRNRFDLTKAVLWASLPSLIAGTSTSYSWNVLPPSPHFAPSVPFYHCELKPSGGGEEEATNVPPLLLLGGMSGLHMSMLGELDATGIVEDVSAYDRRAKCWKKVGELPEPCAGCSCALLPSGELFVAGGGRFRSPLNSAYLGTLLRQHPT